MPEPPPSDPLSTLPVPTSAECNNGNPGTNITVTGATPLTPGTYHNISFDGGTLTLTGGVYCLTGTMSPTSPGKDTIIRDTAGVLIYVSPTGQVNLDSNHVDVTLEAQTSGAYNGIIFYQDRTNSNPVTLSKNDGPWLVDGALYFPSASVDSKNANFASSNFCGMLIAASVDMAKPVLNFDDTCSRLRRIAAGHTFPGRMMVQFERLLPSGRSSERGAALVEVAIALPLLVVILVGTIDFARVFYSALELTNAARAGAQYGTQDIGHSGEAPPMPNVLAAAAAAAPNVAMSVTAQQRCECASPSGVFSPTSPAGACTPAALASCGSANHLVVYVTVTASRTFTLIAPFPGIPNNITLRRNATQRVAY